MGPKPVNMPGTRAVSRCAQCGTVLQGMPPNGLCPKCGFELHSCKQCAYFDPGSRFECMQPVTKRIERERRAQRLHLLRTPGGSGKGNFHARQLYAPTMRGRRSRICSRSRSACCGLVPRDVACNTALAMIGAGRTQRRNKLRLYGRSKLRRSSAHGFCVGRRRISLTKDCGLCVTSMANACATSSGCSIFAGSFPACGLRSVLVEPGQITLTRILWPRSSSATE